MRDAAFISYQLKELRLSTVVDILQSIRQTDMIPLLQTVYGSERGSELCDTLMKYLYVAQVVQYD